MLLVLMRNGEIPYIDSVFDFDTEAELDTWLEKFQQATEPGTFEFTIIPKSEPKELPSYDDPDSVWERIDHIRLVKRILNSKIRCWHCDSDRVTILTDGWICCNCSQHGPRPNEIMNDKEAGMMNNCLYRDFELQKAGFAWDFARPYVCVVHCPTGKGYYLNRNYALIGSVNNIVVPVTDGGSADPDLPHTLTRCLEHETMTGQSGGSIPDWAEGLSCNDFTSYWLY